VPVRVLKLLLLVSLLVTPVSVAAPASAGETCVPRVGHTYRYDSTTFRFGFVIRLCEDLDQVTYETEFTYQDIPSGFGYQVNALGIAPCRQRICVVRSHTSHGEELAGYRVRMFWFGIAFDQIGPLVCATQGSRSECRAAP
jgi:hypothetical protein